MSDGVHSCAAPRASINWKMRKNCDSSSSSSIAAAAAAAAAVN